MLNEIARALERRREIAVETRHAATVREQSCVSRTRKKCKQFSLTIISQLSLDRHPAPAGLVPLVFAMYMCVWEKLSKNGFLGGAENEGRWVAARAYSMASTDRTTGSTGLKAHTHSTAQLHTNKCHTLDGSRAAAESRIGRVDHRWCWRCDEKRSIAISGLPYLPKHCCRRCTPAQPFPHVLPMTNPNVGPIWSSRRQFCNAIATSWDVEHAVAAAAAYVVCAAGQIDQIHVLMWNGLKQKGVVQPNEVLVSGSRAAWNYF